MCVWRPHIAFVPGASHDVRHVQPAATAEIYRCHCRRRAGGPHSNSARAYSAHRFLRAAQPSAPPAVSCAQFKWWAQYLESNGHFDDALQYYERAEDWLAIVRVLCRQQLDKASDIINETGDPAAAYHLARQYEAKGISRKRSISSSGRSGSATLCDWRKPTKCHQNSTCSPCGSGARPRGGRRRRRQRRRRWRYAGRCPLHHRPSFAAAGTSANPDGGGRVS